MYIKQQQQQQNKQELDPEVGKHFLKRPDSNVFSLWAHDLYGKDAMVPL